MKFLLNTTSWENGCGLATISYALSQSSFFKGKHFPIHEPAIQRLLSAFANVYGIPDIQWHMIRRLFQFYQHPEDQQKLWIGPLRYLLGEALRQNDLYRDNLFPIFVAALDQYVKASEPGEHDEYANLFLANKAFFTLARSSYWQVRTTRRELKNREIFQQNKLLTYWHEVGYERYCQQLKNVTGSPLRLTAEELSELCVVLQLKFEIYQKGQESPPTFHRIDRIYQGYEGRKPMQTVSAICSDQHWQPIVDSMSQAFLQQLLWKQGYRQFEQHSYTAILQLARATLLRNFTKYKAPRLEKAIGLGRYQLIAQMSLEQANKLDPDNGFFANIDTAIQEKNYAVLLSIYYYKANARNYILSKSLSRYGTGFVSELLKYYSLLPRGIEDTKVWPAALEKVIPCINRTSGDHDLHVAIRSGDDVSAKKLIAEGDDFYYGNHSKVSPLHLVCQYQNKSLLIAMIEKERLTKQQGSYWERISYFGLDIYKKDANGKTPLHYAAMGSDEHFVAELINLRTNPVSIIGNTGFTDEDGKTPLHIAATNNNPVVLKHFLSHFPLHQGSLNAKDNTGLTPLHYAVAAKKYANISLLLKAKVDPNLCADPIKIKVLFPQFNSQISKLTPLWTALELEDLTAAKLLITNVQQLLKIVNSKGYNALQLAVLVGNTELLTHWDSQFSQARVLFWVDKMGKKLYHLAAMAGKRNVLEYFATKNIVLNAVDNNGNSALHHAAQHGHQSVVQYLCDQAERDYQHNQLVAMRGGLYEWLNRRRHLIEIDVDNKHGETPYALAQIYGHTAIGQLLRQQGAKPVSLPEHVIRTIYRSEPDALESALHKVANIASKHLRIAFVIDEQGDTLIHHAIKGLHERVLRTLLHPLSVADRQAICLIRNRQGLTPLTLIADLRKRGFLLPAAKGKKSAEYRKLSTAQNEVLNKIERLLICYHQETYERQYRTVMQRANYHRACANDLQQEIQRSAGYSYASWATMLGTPVYQAIQTVGITAHPYVIFEKAVSAFLGKDIIANAEQSTNVMLNYFPESTALRGASWALWGLGWCCHTGQKFGIELTKAAARFGLSELALDQVSFASKNYVTYLNTVGCLYAGLEFIGRHAVADFIAQYTVNLESLVTQRTGMRTANQFVNDLLTQLNTAVSEATSVNIARATHNGYGWFRENVIRLPSSGAILLANLDEWILEPLKLADPVQNQLLKNFLTGVIDQNRYDGAKLLEFTESLTQYVATGHQDGKFFNYLTEAATIQSENDQDFGDVIAQFILMAPFYQTEHFTPEQRNSLYTQIAQEANEAMLTANTQVLTNRLSEVLANASTAAVSMLSLQAVETYFLPLLNLQNEELNTFLKQGLTALHIKWIEVPSTFSENWSGLTLYLQQGILTTAGATALDHLATTLVLQGNSYEDMIVLLTMNNAFYQRFEYNPDLKESFSQQLAQAMPAVMAAKSEERVNKLADVLRSEKQHAIDSYVQTLKPGQEVVNDYHNILSQGHNKQSADGLSEYMAQILVFNNPVFFCDLTLAQKQVLQNYFRAFFNQIQGGNDKYNERAVIQNFDLIKTFIICAPYTELITQGASVSEAVPAIFAQLDQNTVRAAVAAYQVAAMIADTPGYEALTITETFELFRDFYDQQYASSSGKIERGIRDIVNETLHEQAIVPHESILLWGKYTADEAANYVAQTSCNIAENRWQGTADVNIRTLKYKEQSSLGRIARSMEREVRKGFKSGLQSSTVGVALTGAQMMATYSHLSSGTLVELSNPFIKPSLVFSMPAKQSTLSQNKPTSCASQPAKEGTAIFTPMLAANDIRPSQVPFWQGESGFWRQVGNSLMEPLPSQGKPVVQQVLLKKDSHSLTNVKANADGQSAVNELLAHSWGQAHNVSLYPELPKSLISLGSTTQSKALLPMVASEPSFGDRLLDLVIGKANANPVVLVGALVAGGTAAVGASLMQSSLATSNSSRDDVAEQAINTNTNLYITSFPVMIAAQGSVGLLKKSAQNDTQRPNAPDRDKKYIPAPKELPGFPEAERDIPKTPYPGGFRKRWELPDGKILEWDSQHGEVELYTKKGDHLGAYDPITGEQIKKPNKNRTIKKFL